MKKNLFSTGSKIAVLGAIAIGMTGCAEWYKRSFDMTDTKGSNFTRALAEEYRMLGDTEQNIMFDDLDAELWYRKGIKAKIGCAVLPEYLNGWRLRNDRVPELAAARERLITAMERGARDVAPEMTAHAQVHFDCWVEQTEEGWQLDDIRACRHEYYKSIREVEHLLGSHVVQGPTAHAVLFNLDDHKLNDEAQKVVDDLMTALNTYDQGRHVMLVGHTDKVGSRSHNKKLAMNRVRSVRDEMVKRGFPANRIHMKVVGEDNHSKHHDPDYRAVHATVMPKGQTK